MDLREELLVLGMVHVGRFKGDAAQSCALELTSAPTVPGAVIMMVAGGAIRMFIATDGDIETRLKGAASALRTVIRDGREPKDEFQREGSELVKRGRVIELYARASSRALSEHAALNRRYQPQWSSSPLSTAG